MARNELVPQDYCNMVISYIHSFRGFIPFTVNDITKYCIKRTKVLDDGDEEKIEHIVYETLETLHQTGYLGKSKSRDVYVQLWDKDVADFDGFVMENPKPMGKVSKEMIDRLKDIDARTRYDG